MILKQLYDMSDGRFFLEESRYYCKSTSHSHDMPFSRTPKHVDAKYIRLPAIGNFS